MDGPWYKDPDWYMVILTALLFIVGAVTLVIFYDQFGEMQAQTGFLNSQARQAAADSIEATRKFERQVVIAQTQAKAAQDSVKAIQRQMRTDQRAWLGIKEITLANPPVLGKPVQISIVGLNTGKTPALDLSVAEVRVGPSETERSRDFVIHIPDREVVAPNNTDVFYATVTYSDDSIRAITAGAIRIYVRGELKYRDVFGLSHTTVFCAYYPTDAPPSAVGHFFNCKTGNSMN